MNTNLPLLPPFSFRYYRGREDLSAILAVHEACREHDSIDPYSVCYRIPNLTIEAYARLLESAPPDTTLLVEKDGKVVAHAWMEAWGFDEQLYLWQVWVVPEWRKIGLGTVLHHWGEAKARELHKSDQRVGLHLANATEGEKDAVTLLLNEGYLLSFISPELAFGAFEILPEIPAIPGIVLRNLEPSEHRAVARALCEANLNSPGQETRWQDEELEKRIDVDEEEWLERVRSSDPHLSPAAWDGTAVAGAYLCQRKDNVGEIAQVAVRAPWRGQGIARALCMHSLHSLKAAGCVTARLFTSIGPDEDEPLTGPYAMYRKFGFYPIARHLRYRKPMDRSTD